MDVIIAGGFIALLASGLTATVAALVAYKVRP